MNDRNLFKMKKSVSALLLALLVTCSSKICARGAQEIVEAGSWVYDAFAAIFIEAGFTDFSDQAPLTIAELRTYLNDIDYDLLSQAGKAQYNRIEEYFSDDDFSITTDILQLGIRPELNFEGYYKTEEDIDWVYNRYYKKPILFAPVFFNVKDYISMGMDLELGINKKQMEDDKDYTNIFLSGGEINTDFPKTGYFSTGYKFTEKTGINLQIGMANQDVNRSLTGSVAQSRYFTGASYANLELFNPTIRYNMNITQFNVNKYMYSHRFDFRLFKKLNLSIQESTLVFAPMELRFFNPLTVYHGMHDWEDYHHSDADKDFDETACAYMVLKASYSVCSGVRLYGLFAMDQFQTAYERSNWGANTTPNARGGQIGVESYFPIKDGYLHTWIEGTYTEPYLYIKESPNWSMARAYTENVGYTDDALYEWIGSPFGPDTISAKLSVGYEVPGKWSLVGSYLFMDRGKLSGKGVFESQKWTGNRFEPDYQNWFFPNKKTQGEDEALRRRDMKTPSGKTPVYVHTVSLRAEYKPFDYMSVMLQPAYTFVQNYKHEKGRNEHGFELALSLNIKLPEMFAK